jgi:predicted nuclease with TOPRIM domain
MNNDSLTLFYNDTQKNFIELKEKFTTQNEIIKKLEEQINKMLLEKAIENEKTQSLNYKLSVMNDKITSCEQKVSDLNNIMMKHFAYKSANLPTTLPQQTTLPTNQPTTLPQQTNKPFTF